MITMPGKKQYPLAPEGIHRAVLADVYTLPPEQNKFGSTNYPVAFIFQLEETDDTGKRFELRLKVPTLSSSPKSILVRTLKSWKVGYSEEHPEQFDLEALIGKNASVNVSHVTVADGRTFANIDAVLPPPKMGNLLTVQDYQRREHIPF